MQELGERKQVTVLFADIVKSSDIIRKHDAEIAESIFAGVLQQQMEITQKFEGTVNQVMGDGIMCLFGAEEPYEEHALRAVAAAREMLRRVREMQAGRKVKIRIGINTGEVMLAPPRNDGYRAVFQATGETVHRTDRILKQARPNSMRVSQSTRDGLEKYYRFKKTGRFQWHGAAAFEDIYEPLSLRLPTVTLRRKREVSLPRAALENRIRAEIASAAAQKKLQMVWLWGAAGIGKTHLLNQCIGKYRLPSETAVQVAFYPDPAAHKDLAFDTTILKALFRGDAQQVLRAASRSLAREDVAFAKDCLRDILHLKGTGASYAALDPQTRAEMKVDLLARLLLAVSRRRAVLLAVEDAHWAGEDFMLFLRRLQERHRGDERLLVFVTSRRASPFRVGDILLDPLTPHESLHLLGMLEGGKAMARRLKEKICRLSEGNPYFLHEYFFSARGMLQLGMSETRVRESFDSKAPGRVADALYNRLAAAGGELSRVARVASVQGMRVNLDLLTAMCGYERKTLIAVLSGLEGAEILRKERLFPAPEWVFTHELLRNVAYQSIPLSARSLWHRAALNEFRKGRFRRVEGRHLLMARHAEGAGDPLRHYVYARWAARHEQEASRHESALEWLLLARKALVKIPGVACAFRHEIRIRLSEIESLFVLRKYAAAKKRIDALLQKKAFLKKIGCFEAVMSFYELYVWIRGNLPQAAKIARTILSADIKRRNKGVYIRENSRLGNIYLDLGRCQEAIACDRNVIHAIPDSQYEEKFGLLTQAKPASFSSLALAYAMIGNARMSQVNFSRAYEFYETGNDVFTRVFILTYLGHSLLLLQKNREALALLRTAYQSEDRVAAPLLAPYLMSAYGLALARTGKPADGAALCRQALKLAKKSGHAVWMPRFRDWHNEAQCAVKVRTGNKIPSFSNR